MNLITTSTEDNRKHLEFIQNTIIRLNGNSFLIKGWAVTLVAALLALFASTKGTSFMIIAMLPIIIFWWLDARYLRTERRFRSLYEDAISNSPRVAVFEMNINKDWINNNPQNQFWNTFKSETIYPFYLILLVLTGISIFFIGVSSKTKDNNLKVTITDTLKTKAIDTIKVKEYKLVPTDSINKKKTSKI